jgi:hypothetical protein
LLISPAILSSARRLALACACACLVGLPSADAQQADEPRYTISQWQGPAACPDQNHFRALLDEALGPATGTPAQGPLELSIRIKKRRGQFHLTLSTKDETSSGSRELQAARCDELLATAAVIVSLALQPDLLYENESDHEVITVPFVQGQASDDEEPLIGATEGETARKRLLRGSGSRGLNVALSLAALAEVGTLPRPALGLALIASARSKDYRLAFRLTQWAEQREYVTSLRPDRGGHFDYLSASLDLCRDFWSGRVKTGACAIGGLGRLNGQSIVIDLPIEQAHIMATAGSGLFVELHTGFQSTLRVQGELVAQLLLPVYTAEVVDPNDDTMLIKTHIHQPSVISARLAASWGLTF